MYAHENAYKGKQRLHGVQSHAIWIPYDMAIVIWKRSNMHSYKLSRLRHGTGSDLHCLQLTRTMTRSSHFTFKSVTNATCISSRSAKSILYVRRSHTSVVYWMFCKLPVYNVFITLTALLLILVTYLFILQIKQNSFKSCASMVSDLWQPCLCLCW